VTAIVVAILLGARTVQFGLSHLRAQLIRRGDESHPASGGAREDRASRGQVVLRGLERPTSLIAALLLIVGIVVLHR
jgi:hypothetical protein